jgi:hypothetical protein
MTLARQSLARTSYEQNHYRLAEFDETLRLERRHAPQRTKYLVEALA